MTNRFEVGFDVICIQEYDKLKLGQICHIIGCGSLELSRCGKSGYGFCIKCEKIIKMSSEALGYKNYKTEEVDYYFTEEEMDEYFILSTEDFKSHVRNKKIEKLL